MFFSAIGGHMTAKILVFNDILAFILELVALYFWGKLVYNMFDHKIVRMVLAILVVIVVAAIWGVFFSPKASRAIPGMLGHIIKYLILTFPSLQFVNSNKFITIFMFVVVFINYLMMIKLGLSELGP